MFPNLPVRDSVLAIADEDYFDWPVLPEAPHSLSAAAAGNAVRLRWEIGDAVSAIVERRAGDSGGWTRLATQAATNREFTDSNAPAGAISLPRAGCQSEWRVRLLEYRKSTQIGSASKDTP